MVSGPTSLSLTLGLDGPFWAEGVYRRPEARGECRSLSNENLLGALAILGSGIEQSREPGLTMA